MSKTKKITVIAAVALLVAIVIAAGAWYITRPEAHEGAKNITFTIVYNDKTEEVIEIDTDAEYLANALVEEGIITYDESGFYTTIKGVTADYHVDTSWWAIYEGETMASVGLNELPVIDGGSYAAVYTIGF